MNTFKYIKNPVMVLGILISTYFAVQCLISVTQLMWLGGVDKKTLLLNISFFALSVITSAFIAMLFRFAENEDREEGVEVSEEGDIDAFADISNTDKIEGN